MPHAAVNGTNIHYHESGHGLPVVLLHGFPLDHRVWHKQVHDLSHVCRVITPDLRGFGHSTGGGSFTIASLADDIYVLLSQIHALPCVLGGLSMGGYVALEYERHNAATLRGLMLIDTRSGADSPEGRAGRDVMIEVAKTQGSVAIANKMLPKMLAGGNVDEDSPVVRELKSIMDACPAQTIQYALAAMRDRIDYTPTLSRIAAPTLIVAGESDVLTPPAQSEEMHKAIDKFIRWRAICTMFSRVAFQHVATNLVRPNSSKGIPHDTAYIFADGCQCGLIILTAHLDATGWINRCIQTQLVGVTLREGNSFYPRMDLVQSFFATLNNDDMKVGI